MRATVACGWLLLAAGVPGCCIHRVMVIPPPPAVSRPGVTHSNISATASEYFPSEARHFSARQKINPFWWLGNADDPAPPEWYRPGGRLRPLTWQLRNPCHNFTFYVVGIADKPFLRIGRHPDKISREGGGWTCAVDCYHHWRLPFVDYARGRFEFYLGWRTAGNFGFKLNFRKRLPDGLKPMPGAPVTCSAIKS